jgi:glutaredoxin
MITFLGADWCPACVRTKKTLKELNMDYKYVEIPPGQAGWDLVETMTGKRSIPQIFYHFGGSKDFNEALTSLNLIGESTQ